eukprot:37901-Chlamydomonas_euryale.AAC.1
MQPQQCGLCKSVKGVGNAATTVWAVKSVKDVGDAAISPAATHPLNTPYTFIQLTNFVHTPSLHTPHPCIQLINFVHTSTLNTPHPTFTAHQLCPHAAPRPVWHLCTTRPACAAVHRRSLRRRKILESDDDCSRRSAQANKPPSKQHAKQTTFPTPGGRPLENGASAITNPYSIQMCITNQPDRGTRV